MQPTYLQLLLKTLETIVSLFYFSTANSKENLRNLYLVGLWTVF